jgi:hypothetical protein
MSYTLRGRIESRLAAAVLPVAVAAVWSAFVWGSWPLEVAALMLAVGLVLDAGAYHRLLPYQAGWLALPLGLAELAAVLVCARAFDVPAPLAPAVAFYAAAWLWAQVLGHAALPLAHMQYAEDGGELGRAGVPLTAAVAVGLALAGGVAWTSRPPTVHLHGVVRGPLHLTHPQTLTGGVVYGGIVVSADHVTIRDVAVVGGDNGIDIEDAHHVMLDRVRVSGAREDGIHARQSSVMVEDCVVLAQPGTQGIDLSFAMDDGMSEVRGCTVHGGDVGITAHTLMADIRDNTVTGAGTHAIELTEMSMGEVRGNDVRGAAIYCGDHSECEVRGNSVLGTRGPGILSFYYAVAHLDDNTLVRSRRPAAAANATLRGG